MEIRLRIDRPNVRSQLSAAMCRPLAVSVYSQTPACLPASLLVLAASPGSHVNPELVVRPLWFTKEEVLFFRYMCCLSPSVLTAGRHLLQVALPANVPGRRNKQTCLFTSFVDAVISLLMSSYIDRHALSHQLELFARGQSFCRVASSTLRSTRLFLHVSEVG